MKVLRYFQLYMIVLLWIQIKSTIPDVETEQSAALTAYEIGKTHGMLVQLETALMRTRNGFLKNWLLERVREEQELAIALMKTGFVNAGFIERSKR